jgi:hypothetical protein
MNARYAITTAALLWVVGAAQTTWAIGGQFGKGNPRSPIRNSTWPVGTEILANRADRSGGFWINSLDTFFYSGDVRAFNAFLQQYAKVQGAQVLVLQGKDDPMALFGLQPRTGSADWQLDAGLGQATVVLSLKGRIALADLHVPGTLKVQFEGTPTREEAAFLARYQSQQR